MEAHGRLVGEPPSERAETSERALGRVLVELPDRRRDLRLCVCRRAASRPLERLRRRDRPADALQTDPVEEELRGYRHVRHAP